MRKSAAVLLSFVLTVLLCSCGIPDSKRECFSVPESFICDVEISNKNKEYKGMLERTDGKYIFTVTSPDELSGLVTEYENGKYSVKYSESEAELSPQEDFFLVDIIEFIESVSADENVLCEEKDGAYIIKQNGWTLSFAQSDK